jgi:hypothetical protein
MYIYAGTFLLALVMLALEITLTRILSVTTWYYLAFFTISTAMLGMTAAATVVYLYPKRYAADRLQENLGRACLGFAIAVPVALILLCMIPVTADFSLMSVFGVLGITAACALPFYFAGIAITLVLTKSSLPVGLVYASDLIGAAMGCLLVLGGLEVLDAPSLILLCGSFGAVAGMVYVWNVKTTRLRMLNVGAAIVLGVLSAANAQSSRLIRPLVIKNRIEPASTYDIEKWNSFSRITVFPSETSAPDLWAGSSTAPSTKVLQRAMQIDGSAGTIVQQFRTMADIEHLRYDVTNVAHAVRPHGAACVIGVGGGRDIQSALLFGHSKVVGIDVNPIFISLLANQFRDFANIAGRDDVTLVVDEARSYLSRSNEKFSTIQMSLIDTWAATGAGAMTLSENSLYTVEAWKVFVDRLADDGLFTVSRWYSRDDLGETGRLLSLAVMVLLEDGVNDPRNHIALITQGSIATLILSKRPMSPEDVDKLEAFCRQMQFPLVASPRQIAEHPQLKRMLSAHSPDELYQAVQDSQYRFDPPTDEDPYFFNMLRLRDLFRRTGLGRTSGILGGNVVATKTLVGLILALAIMSVFAVLIPLILRGRIGEAVIDPSGVVWEGALYFSLIGSGFMLLEVAMMQRLSVFLGHPVYALGIVLFAIILSTGIGSLFSERLPTRAPWVFIYSAAACLLIICSRFALTALTANLVAAPMATKIACSVVAILPVGLILGVCFPIGMRLVRTIHPGETPWYWALNGIFGVLSSAVAVFVSIFLGISTNFYLSAACYGLAFVCVIAITKRLSMKKIGLSEDPITLTAV